LGNSFGCFQNGQWNEPLGFGKSKDRTTISSSTTPRRTNNDYEEAPDFHVERSTRLKPASCPEQMQAREI